MLKMQKFKPKPKPTNPTIPNRHKGIGHNQPLPRVNSPRIRKSPAGAGNLAQNQMFTQKKSGMGKRKY